MIDFGDTTLPQCQVLQQALDLTNYATVCAGVLAVTDQVYANSEGTKHAIGRLGERMAWLNGGQPDAGSILHTIATTKWEDNGITGVPALEPTDRAGLIAIVMTVSKQIISAEINRLQGLVDVDADLPEGWLDAPGDNNPDDDNNPADEE